MIKKLLFVFTLFFSVEALSQLVITTPPDLEATCGNLFDLTSQEAAILNGQNPDFFLIQYHLTLQDAQWVFNEILNPESFSGIDGQIIYVSVQDLTDETGEIGITSFSLIVSGGPVFPPLPDIVSCDFYVLPALPAGLQYYQLPGGDNPLAEGYICTFNQTIYVRSEGSECVAEESFFVTILASPQFAQVSDVSACDSYLLPVLPPQYSYWTGPNGTGTPIQFGMTITSSMVIHVLGQNGSCTSDASFTVTITNSSDLPLFPDVVSCGSYFLPPLPAGQSYHATSGGNSPLSSVIEQTMVVYVFSETGTVPNCISEASFTVTIHDGTPMNPIEDVIACHSYVLPELPPNGTYSFNGVLLTGTEPFVISQSGIVTLDVQGFCPENFQVMIHDVTPDALAPVLGCDDNNDGFAIFDLEAYTSNLPEAIDYEIRFFESQTYAELNMNPLPMEYSNIVANTQTIYLRVSNSPDCYSITPLSLITIQCGTITGIVLIDADNNGCSATDMPLANQQVVCTNGNGETYAYTNDEGIYAFSNVPEGTAVIYALVPAMWTMAPVSHEIDVEGGGAIVTADFCASPPPQVTDAGVTIIPMDNPRPGFSSSYILQVSNLGTVAINGSVTFTYDPTMVSFLSSFPSSSSQTATSVTFDFSNLPAYDHLNYYLGFSVMTPPTVEAGDQLSSSAVVTISTADINSDNNTTYITQTVVNSYDPNDITCHEGAFIAPDQADDFLTYTIRFQNTGTAEAVNVRLENELDELLDWSTFQPIASSHTYLAERDGSSVVFRYNNIMLEASSVDEPASHGFVTYRVQPRPGLEIGDVISNTADIFFDFNAPITTNTATTQIQQLGVNQNQLLEVVIYPNPASERFNIRCSGCDSADVLIVDLQGKIVLDQSVDFRNDTTLIDVSEIASGMYFLRLEVGDSVEVRKLVVN